MRGIEIAVLLSALAVAATLAACGSETANPPAAEPAEGPPLQTKPVGKVIDLKAKESEGLAVDPETGIVAAGTRDPDRLVLIDDPLAKRPKLRIEKLPESGRHMQLLAPGGPILTTSEQTDDLIEISLPSGKLETIKVGDFPHDAAEAANSKIFVGDEGGDTLTVVDNGAATEELPAPEQPGGVEADGNLIGVIAVSARVLASYDADTLEKTGEVDAGVGPTHLVAGDDHRFYVTDTEGDAILIFSAEPEPKLLDRVNVPDSPYGIAIDNANNRLWVTRTGANLLTEYELTDRAPKRLASFPTVRQPNTVAVDPKSGLVFVSGRKGAQLQVVDPSADRSGG